MTIEPQPACRGDLPGAARISARVRYRKWWAAPEVLWFDLPSALARANSGVECWMLALAPLACAWREPLEADGPADPAFLKNLRELMERWTRWHPGLGPVEILAHADNVRSRNEASARTGLFFTGGIDSFFTALHYGQAGNGPVSSSESQSGTPPAVDELVYVWGYDLPLKKQSAFQAKLKCLSQAAAALGKPLRVLASNLRLTRAGKIPWGPLGHGPALGAAGLALGGCYSTMLISSSYGPKSLRVWGSHPDLDPLYSTTDTRFLHYGNFFDRFTKTEFVSRSAAALGCLHVCWKEESERNCGRCEKCLRTQLALEILGRRGAARTFPPDTFSAEALVKLRVHRELYEDVYPGLRLDALRHGRPDLAQAIADCIERNRRLDGAK